VQKIPFLFLPLLATAVVAMAVSACGGDDDVPPGAQPIDGAILFDDTGTDGTFPPPSFDAGIDTATPVDATCAPPRGVPGTSSDCYPVGPASEQCVDASTSGWLYACPVAADAAAAPTGMGGCLSYTSFALADAAWTASICPTLACTRAAGEDGIGCDAGHAFACPADSLDDGGALAPASCTRSGRGWASGVGMPGPVYCCP
jgi:hypothetical protein